MSMSSRTEVTPSVSSGWLARSPPFEGRSIRFPETDPPESGPPIDGLLAVEVRDPDLCPRFVGRWVGGVRVGASPDRVQMRLRAAGVRPISNVVDASNYVLLELGKPIHTFDAASVGGGDGPRQLIVRRAAPGERIETLDHVERDLDPDTLVIANADGPLAIAGIMGGASSEVSDATTDVIVESAIFDPISIRRTGQRYGLRSEASLRFEKGQEYRLARLGADRTARLIVEWAGGAVADGERRHGAPRAAARPSRVPPGPCQSPPRHVVAGGRAARPAGPRRDRGGAGAARGDDRGLVRPEATRGPGRRR